MANASVSLSLQCWVNPSFGKVKGTCTLHIHVDMQLQIPWWIWLTTCVYWVENGQCCLCSSRHIILLNSTIKIQIFSYLEMNKIIQSAIRMLWQLRKYGSPSYNQLKSFVMHYFFPLLCSNMWYIAGIFSYGQNVLILCIATREQSWYMHVPQPVK